MAAERGSTLGSAKPATYTVDDLVVDVGTRQVFRGAECIALPDLSFSLLVALLRAAPNLLTYDELMQQVWPGLVVSLETITRRVKLVRDALGDDAHSPRYIAGVRSHGYRIIAGVALSQLEDDRAHSVASALTAISGRSIAVLPFTDMSQRKDQEFLADGIAEEILTLLAKVPDLLVSARTSSFCFKGKPTKIPDIARELGVAHVLEGSIRRSGHHLRVTAQLIRADNGYQLWSETYDRELRDVFQVQDDIAYAVVQALQIKLAGGELSREKGGTQNLEAYQLYLRANSAYYQNTKSSMDAASEYLDQAIKLDPGYGMACWRLALTFIIKTTYGSLAATEGYERARQLAQHALHLSPNSADARATLQYVYLNYDWDWAAAETEARRALAIDPTNVRALIAAGALSRTLGRWDDAERQFRLALDPRNPYVIWGLGGTYYGAGRYGEAEAMYRKLLELAPGFLWTRTGLGQTLLAAGRPEEALEMVQQEVDEGYRLLLLPLALQAVGRKAEADEALQAQIARWADTGAFDVARTYAYRGDHDLALQWLERAYEQKDVELVFIVGDHLFKNIADDPRFNVFLRKMKLPE